jgi:predicted DNA-binding protein with PD1-like motif
MTRDKLTVITIPKNAGTDELFEELREVARQSKYDNVTISELIGVFEMLKMHYWRTTVLGEE